MKSNLRDAFAPYTDKATFDRIKEMGTVSEMWQRCVKDYASDIAIEDDGRQFTYADIESDVSALRPLINGERVGIYCVNSYEFVSAFLAVTTSGKTAVILPPQLDAMTVFGCCIKYGISQLIYHPALEANLEIVKVKRPDITLTSATERSGEKCQIVFPSPSSPCVIMFTGGTTGKSKGALLSNEAVMQGVVNGCYGYKNVFGMRYLLVLPLSHVFGLIRNLLTSLYTGSDLFICRNNKDMFRDVAVFRPTILVLVPALAEMALMLSKKFGKNMLGDSMQYIICGAAAVAPYIVTEYQKYGITVFPGYGLTESANLVSGNPESLSHPDSVGYLYPNQEYQIVGGELWLKGLNMLTSYVGEDVPAYDDGWFKTGDLVRFDDNGLMYITGRTKEIIVLSNGENISPAEVEARFDELKCISASQVFEDVTETGEHILALEVVPRATELAGVADVNSYIIAELQKVNAALPSYQRVQKMTVRDSDFARTPSMKIVRYKKCQDKI